MNMEHNHYYIVEETDDSFVSWLVRPYISDSLKEQLTLANVLIIPTEGFREHSEPLFPEGTEMLFAYLQDHKDSSIHPDILIEEQDYKEFAMHYDLVTIGKFLVEIVVAPIFVGLLTNYIQNRLGSKVNKSDVNVELIVVDGGKEKATRLYYQGSAEQFQDKIMPVVQTLIQGKKDLLHDESDSNQGKAD